MSQLNSNTIYAYPRLSTADLWFMRLGGNGLGNLLITWARCIASARRHGWQVIWPTWFSYKAKNWRLNPYDVRTYSDLFRPTDAYVTWPGKPWRLMRARATPESLVERDIKPGSVVQFRGMQGFFAPFVADHGHVLSELLAMTRAVHFDGWRAAEPAPIAIHVRRGDFIGRAAPATVELHNSQLPLEWYIKALKAVREEVGQPLPVWLFSDGKNQELDALMRLPGVQRVSFGSSIADILAMARCRFLIASGSTFSMWGSYLGQLPTLWHSGKLLQPLLLDDAVSRGWSSGPSGLEFEWTDGDALPAWIGPALTPIEGDLTTID